MNEKICDIPMHMLGGLNINVLSIDFNLRFSQIDKILLENEFVVNIAPLGLLVVPDVNIINLSLLFKIFKLFTLICL